MEVKEVDKSHQKNEELDAFSFLSLMQSRYLKYTFDSVIIDGFVDELKSQMPEITGNQVSEAFETGKSTIDDYKEHIANENFKINPFTETRFLLYLFKPQILNSILYPGQLNRFLQWLEDIEKKNKKTVL